MEHTNSAFGERHNQQINEIKQVIVYFIRETQKICLHLEKLDKLPLDRHFDFRMYFDQKEFVYLGDPDRSPPQYINPT